MTSPHPFSLAGKVALVTGAARGIGWAMAEALAAAGAAVALADIDGDGVAARAGQLQAGGATALPVVLDVADGAAVAGAVDTITARLGRLDILCANAGINIRGALGDIAPADFERVMAVNATAQFLLARACAPVMRRHGWGRIVFTASVMGHISRPGTVAYTTSKGAVKALTRALAVELAPEGITVNAICPGYVATEMNTRLLHDPEFDGLIKRRTPVGRWAEPREIAAAAVFLASPAASYVNGHLMLVDGGLTVAL